MGKPNPTAESPEHKQTNDTIAQVAVVGGVIGDRVPTLEDDCSCLKYNKDSYYDK